MDNWKIRDQDGRSENQMQRGIEAKMQSPLPKGFCMNSSNLDQNNCRLGILAQRETNQRAGRSEGRRVSYLHVTNLEPQCHSALVTSPKAAFTLAEVLITLGIIGVVAALTMPVLIQNYRKHVVETRLAHFYSVMNQAIVRAEADYGDRAGWDNLWEYNENNMAIVGNEEAYNTRKNWFNKYLKPYIKTIDVSKNETRKSLVVTLANGSLFEFGSDNFVFYPNKNIFNSSNSRKGRDCFEFVYVSPNSTHHPYALGKGVEPYVGSWGGERESLFSHPDYGCNSQVSTSCVGNGNKYCTKLIQMNGWKVPKDYPYKF